MATYGFPWPIIGNYLDFSACIKNATMDTPNPAITYMLTKFGVYYPKIVVDCSFVLPTLFINDPQILNELYITKGKYLDKNRRTSN